MLKILKSIFIASMLVTFASAATKISEKEKNSIEALTLFKGKNVAEPTLFSRKKLIYLTATLSSSTTTLT